MFYPQICIYKFSDKITKVNHNDVDKESEKGDHVRKVKIIKTISINTSPGGGDMQQ